MPSVITQEEVEALMEVVDETHNKNYLGNLHKEQRRLKNKLNTKDLNSKESEENEEIIKTLINHQSKTLCDIEFSLGTILDEIDYFEVSGSVNDPEIKVFQNDKNLLELLQDLKYLRESINDLYKININENNKEE